ncbi:uncharacterized protein LOC129752500 [Uranotaenia lowii]|uniref:uncharacterized protein LOC129752500 n=1 Tax=Uranotaenia lowii TaxID=190385 RepID=UPI00247971A1|nr:uncharacterized protein LOC129752500 [Uranotaenia lowii]
MENRELVISELTEDLGFTSSVWEIFSANRIFQKVIVHKLLTAPSATEFPPNKLSSRSEDSCSVSSAEDDLDKPGTSYGSVPNPLSKRKRTNSESDEDGESCPEPKCSTDITFSPKLLEEILRKTEEGKEILERARSGPLSDQKVRKLTAIVIQFHLQTYGSKRTTAKILEDYDKAIRTLLKHEPRNIYYIPKSSAKTSPGGTLSNRLGNIRKKNRNEAKREDQHQRKIRKVDVVETPSLESGNSNTWLLLNQEPWTTVLEKWESSFDCRKHLLRCSRKSLTLLTTYHHYKLNSGYQLIDLDYEKLFGDAQIGMRHLESSRSNIVTYISAKARDPSAPGIVNHFFHSTASEDSKWCAVLIGLNTILLPISTGARFRPSIQVAQEDTIIWAENEFEIGEQVQKVYAAYAESRLPLTPKLVAVGKDYRDVRGPFYVYYHSFYYKFSTALRAIDVLIKLTAVLGLPFSKLSQLVWQFISASIYELPISERYINIVRLSKHLKSTKA